MGPQQLVSSVNPELVPVLTSFFLCLLLDEQSSSRRNFRNAGQHPGPETAERLVKTGC